MNNKTQTDLEMAISRNTLLQTWAADVHDPAFLEVQSWKNPDVSHKPLQAR